MYTFNIFLDFSLFSLAIVNKVLSSNPNMSRSFVLIKEIIAHVKKIASYPNQHEVPILFSAEINAVSR